MSEFTEFPKMLYKGKHHHIVHSEDEEAALLAEGYTQAPSEVPEPPPVDAPTPCAKCAELEATIERLDREARGYVLTVENLEARLAAASEPQTGETPKSTHTRRARA